MNRQPAISPLAFLFIHGVAVVRGAVAGRGVNVLRGHFGASHLGPFLAVIVVDLGERVDNHHF